MKMRVERLHKVMGSECCLRGSYGVYGIKRVLNSFRIYGLELRRILGLYD